MKLAAICCTYKRPRLLEEVIECFLRQDYPASQRELIILDDAGQYQNMEGEGWCLISLNKRFVTLGEKRNATIALAGDADAFCVWDDDDIYLPWHMSAAAATLEHADYVIPTQLYEELKNKELAVKDNRRRAFHGAWSFSRTAFEKAHGYPFIQSGQDYGLHLSFIEQKLRYGDSIAYDSRPSFIYRWWTMYAGHISAGGVTYEMLGEQPFEPHPCLTPHWDKDYVQLHDVAAVA